MTPEGRVKAKVKRALKEFGPRVFMFMPVQSGYGVTGLDFFLCVGGWFVAIETKVKGKTLSPRQKIVWDMLVEAGALVFLVDDDESLEKAMKRLRAMVHA